jgi:hypothetical protein
MRGGRGGGGGGGGGHGGGGADMVHGINADEIDTVQVLYLRQSICQSFITDLN